MFVFLLAYLPERLDFYRNEAERKAQFLLNWPDVEYVPYDIVKLEYMVWLDDQNQILLPSYAKLTFKAKQNLDSLYIHFEAPQMNIDSVKSSVSFTYTWDTLIVFRFLPAVPQNDTFTIEIYYQGTPIVDPNLKQGLNFATGYIFTQGEPYGTRKWLPIYDQPYFKVDTVVARIRVRDGWRAVANGALIDSTVQSISGETWITYTWKESYRITPYLIVFAASDRFKVFEQIWNYDTISMKVYHYVDSSISFYSSYLPNMLTGFSELFGLYPFHTEKYAEVHIANGFFGGAMENQTNTFTAFIGLEGLSAHELAHHWWGDLVTCATFKDIVLNEGFATYSEALWKEISEGYASYKTLIGVFIDYYLSSPDYHNMSLYDPGPDIWDIFSPPLVYAKGSAVLHMLRLAFRDVYGASGDSMFFEALRYYKQQRAFSYASVQDFLNDMNTFTSNDFSWFFNQWFFTPGHPKLDIGWNKEFNGTSWTVWIRVRQVQDPSWMYYRMNYPVRFIFTDNTSKDTILPLSGIYEETFTFEFNNEVLQIIPDPENDYIDEVVNLTGLEETSRDFVFKNNTIYVNVSSPTVLEIYDVSGKLLYRENVRGLFSKRLDYNSRILIVKLGKRIFKLLLR